MSFGLKKKIYNSYLLKLTIKWNSTNIINFYVNTINSI